MARSALSRSREMIAASYNFRIGSFEGTVVRDGQFNVAANYLYSNAPADELALALTAHDQPERIAVHVANHFDFPCLGRVIPYRRGWQWEPINTDRAES